MNAIMDVRNAGQSATRVADELVGRLIHSFSEIESAVEGCLRQLAGGHLFSPLVDRLVFKQRLDTLRDMLALRQGTDPLRFNEFLPLHRRIDRLRSRRNAFVHGRWHARTASFQLSCLPRGPLSGRIEKLSNLAMLREELAQLDVLAVLLHRWCERWFGGVGPSITRSGRMVCNAVVNRPVSGMCVEPASRTS